MVGVKRFGCDAEKTGVQFNQPIGESSALWAVYEKLINTRKAHPGMRPSNLSFMCRPNPAVGWLQPTPHGELVIRVLGAESSFQILLLSGYDDVVHESHRPNERD
jgi:hypothetical protein